MKIIFIQLPLIDHGNNFLFGNIPYAPAVLSMYINRFFSQYASASYVSSNLVNYLSDDELVKHIKGLDNDIVSFTIYMWNAERSLTLARRIKNETGKVIFMGGPEIQKGSFIFKEKVSFIDRFITGEGERFFRDYLGGKMIPEINHSGKVYNKPGTSITRISEIMEPFGNNGIDPMSDGSMAIEITRGCHHRCCYCNYSKSITKVRQIPIEGVLRGIRKGKEKGLKEMYLMSPSFDRNPDFITLLESFEKEDHGISIHTEMRTGRITKEIAFLMYRAGFRSIETGIQTMTEKSRKMIGRNGNVTRELKGIGYLLEAGITVKIGLIPGLPGDTPEEFKKTIWILNNEGLGQYLEIYPLMALPGTMMRETADQKGYLFQEKPPYYIIKNEAFDSASITEINRYHEDITGYESAVKTMPDLGNDGEGFIKGVIINTDGRIETDAETIGNKIQTAVSIVIVKGTERDRVNGFLMEQTEKIIKNHNLANIIIHCDQMIDEELVYKVICDTDIDSYNKRKYLYSISGNSTKAIFFHIFESVEQYQKAREVYQHIKPIMGINRDNYHIVTTVNWNMIPMIFVERGVSEMIADWLVFWYSGYFDMVEFESNRDKEKIYTKMNIKKGTTLKTQMVSV